MALISFAVTAKLICVFVFAYAKCWFSHDAAQIKMVLQVRLHRCVDWSATLRFALWVLQRIALMLWVFYSLKSLHHGNSNHYENTPMQYTAIFHGCKNDNSKLKFFDYFHIFAQNIYCGYALEPPNWGGSNEYPQFMFLSKNKKIM